jgi:anti-sigma factor (TIGR02949 family)
VTNWIRRLFGRAPEPAMSCEDVGLVLQQYLDDEIDAETADRIAEHLEECRRCGMEAETYERIKATLARKRAPLPDDSVARLREFGAQLARGEEPAGS